MEIAKVPYEPMNEVHENEMKIFENLLNKLKNNENYQKEFDEFFEDVIKHFEFEENLMKKYNFFAYIPHKMEHDKIIEELKEIKNENRKNILKYMEERYLPWLDQHIKTIDTVTAGFLKTVEEQQNGI